MRSKKTSLLIVAVMLATVFAVVVSGNVGGTIPDGMVSYWKLDEGSGDIAGDSADGNDGTLKPCGYFWTTGQIDGGLGFDGIDDYVNIPHLFSGNGDITMSAWINFESPSPSQHFEIIFIGKPNYNQAIHIFQWGGNGQLGVGKWGGPNAMTSENYNDGYWHHVVGRFYNGNTYDIYVDGVLRASNTGTYNIPLDGETAFGGRQSYNCWNGLMDEVVIYDRVLTPTEIISQYNNGLAGIETTPDTDTIGLWHLDDGSGNTASDSSTNNNDGTLLPLITNNPPTWTTGQVGGALSFDGVDDYVRIGNLGPFPTQGTIEFWMNPSVIENYRNAFTTRYNGGPKGIRFEEQGSYGGHTNTFIFGIANDDQTIYKWWRIASDQLGNPIQVNNWYHVALTWDKTTNNVKGYMDGTLMVDDFITGWPTSLPDVAIGTGFSTSYERQWKGLVDEVAIWNIALSEDEIQDHYLSGLEGKGYFLDPEEAVEDLFDDLQIMNLPEGTENSLLTKLDTALNCLDNGNDNAAINILNAFINAVAAQSGKKLTVAQADSLIGAAQDILDTI